MKFKKLFSQKISFLAYYFLGTAIVFTLPAYAIGPDDNTKNKIKAGYAIVSYDANLSSVGYYTLGTGQINIRDSMDNRDLAHELHHAKNDLTGLMVLGSRENTVNEISASGAEYLSGFMNALPIRRYQKYYQDFQWEPHINQRSDSLKYKNIGYTITNSIGDILAARTFKILPGRELNALANAVISSGIDKWNNDNGFHDNQIFINKQLEVDGKINRPENYNEQENIEKMFTYKINGRKTNLLRLASADVRNRLDSIINATEHRADSLFSARKDVRE